MCHCGSTVTEIVDDRMVQYRSVSGNLLCSAALLVRYLYSITVQVVVDFFDVEDFGAEKKLCLFSQEFTVF